jgi:DNA polymerase kappa
MDSDLGDDKTDPTNVDGAGDDDRTETAPGDVHRAREATESASTNTDSLKYRLLGPSLTKAGQDTVDQQKVSEIIYEASKGSKFFANEQARDHALTEKITRIIVRRDQLLKLDLSHATKKADDLVAGLEATRDLTQTIVHIDCDAFYAAVEELARPELKEVPMAVGRGVVTTCNYVARKFGVRSGMASFVAMKLCPQLICLPNDFAKYMAKAEEVRTVLARYDPRYESASCDEAYLNITKYCQDSELSPWDAVQKMRAEVHEHTGITVSAGIAANGKLAKIGSNKNKPNGQFMVHSDRESIMAFMRDLPTRKVNGIGRVFERELDAIGIKSVGDVYEYRHLLASLFGDKANEFLLRTYLGLGRTQIAPAEEYERKSVGTERTFSELQGKEPLRQKLRDIAVELENDLKKSEVKGRTLVLKVKLYTFEVLTRQSVTPFAVHKADDLERFALPMLSKLEKEFHPMRLRLMGLRCTSLVSTQKVEVDFFGTKHTNKAPRPKVDSDGWEIWPETEFENAAEQEREQEMEEMRQLSQEHEEMNATPNFWDCPVCGRPQPTDEKLLNEHIDSCLSKQAIRDVVRSERENLEHSTPKLRMEPAPVKKRGRPKSAMNGSTTTDDTQRHAKRMAFFTGKPQ